MPDNLFEYVAWRLVPPSPVPPLLAPAYAQLVAEGQSEPATIKVAPASEVPRPSSNATNDDAQGAPADEPRNAPGDEAASGSTKDDDADAAVTAVTLLIR